MPTLKLVLEYDGARYHGWQRQPDRPTVQGALEKAVSTVAQAPIPVTGAGRTDSGVHAEGQTAHFKTESRLKPGEWMRALNSLLPEDIAVRSVENVSNKFHARYSAKGKIYRYRIFNSRSPRPLGRHYRWTVFIPLNISTMRAAAKAFLGRHDFSSLQSADPSREAARSAVCAIRRIALGRKGDELTITIEADRFLKQMARTLVGTLVEVGRGRRRPEEMKALIRSRDRRRCGVTAPPQGLCLVKVKY
ncbi:MAG TPA: tRNA pseudouridine(38-40) synthase TruA [Nitrospiria bacterium]